MALLRLPLLRAQARAMGEQGKAPVKTGMGQEVRVLHKQSLASSLALTMRRRPGRARRSVGRGTAGRVLSSEITTLDRGADQVSAREGSTSHRARRAAGWPRGV